MCRRLLSDLSVIQIPSNLVVARVGVRRWLSVLLLGWGTVASCMSLINNQGSFFALRLLLGLFEAGAVPAMWYHLSTFYPADRCGDSCSTALCWLIGCL